MSESASLQLLSCLFSFILIYSMYEYSSIEEDTNGTCTQAPTPSYRAKYFSEIGILADEIALCLPNGDLSTSQFTEHAKLTGVLAPGTVIRDQTYSASSTVTVSLSPHLHLEIPVPRWQHRSFQIAVGMPVMLRIPCEAVHLFEPDDTLLATQARNSINRETPPGNRVWRESHH